MTRKEFLARYGQEKVHFKRYYKFLFTFSNPGLEVGFGGQSADIYRWLVETQEYTITALEQRQNLVFAIVPADSINEYWP